MAHSECACLLNASRALLKRSGLVNWTGEAFVATHQGNDDSCFENYAKNTFDPDYGRYICWVLFSVGAENLAKAACVCNGVVSQKVSSLGYPKYDDAKPVMGWVEKVLNESMSASDLPAEKYYYGNLEKYWKPTKHRKAHLDALCDKRDVVPNDRKLLIASYKYLTQAIRNRDAHTYVPEQRQKNYPAVQPIFVPSFNTLVCTMKCNGHPGLGEAST